MDKKPDSASSGCSCCSGHHFNEISRRKFFQLTGKSFLGSVALTGIKWSDLSKFEQGKESVIKRKSLIVKPVLTYATPVPRKQTSWREWGGIQTEDHAAEERKRIEGELKSIQSHADFPFEMLPLSSVKSEQDLKAIDDLSSADVFIVYAAGGSMRIFEALNKMGRNMIFFCRHRSGPVYLWYEIISPRFLRNHTDSLVAAGLTENDVVIDNPEEILWRLRALCGMKSTLDSRILAVGGAGGWSQPKAPELAKEKFRLDIVNVPYEDLGKLIQAARSDESMIAQSKRRAQEYLSDSSLRLETKREFVENCFMLQDIFIRLMETFRCRAITINNCMSTIMPLAETSACLTLSLLNDAGYLAFCESDFVVVPAGILLANISGKPVFLNDPTYPHDGLITLAHCTAPRRMDGQKLEPARILTHFESDYGAAPKVEMLINQVVTNIIPDFEFKRNIGFVGKIADNPFLDICRSQIDVSFGFDSILLAGKMPGFHWMTAYGDYVREYGYSMGKLGIGYEKLG